MSHYDDPLDRERLRNAKALLPTELHTRADTHIDQAEKAVDSVDRLIEWSEMLSVVDCESDATIDKQSIGVHTIEFTLRGPAIDDAIDAVIRHEATRDIDVDYGEEGYTVSGKFRHNMR